MLYCAMPFFPATSLSASRLCLQAPIVALFFVADDSVLFAGSVIVGGRRREEASASLLPIQIPSSPALPGTEASQAARPSRATLCAEHDSPRQTNAGPVHHPHTVLLRRYTT
jgi:hypothetical protein